MSNGCTAHGCCSAHALSMDELELEPSFRGSLPNVGRYEVELIKVAAEHVRVSSRGIVEGEFKAEDTVVFD